MSYTQNACAYLVHTSFFTAQNLPLPVQDHIYLPLPLLVTAARYQFCLSSVGAIHGVHGPEVYTPGILTQALIQSWPL